MKADKVLDAPLRTIVGCLAEVLPKGPAQTALYWVAGLCILAAPVMYKYYIGVLAQGAAPEGSIERQDYDKLRASLKGGNLAARLYAKWLTAFLDGVERFFGDAGTEGQRAFGLKKAAPLWTAPAFDRCLLLALIYPIATIFLIWAISGHVGPAERALRLKPDISGWARGLSAAVGFGGFAIWRVVRTERWKSSARAIFADGGAVAGAIALSGAGTVAVLAAFHGAGVVGVIGAVAGAGAVAVSAAGAAAGAVAVIAAVANAGGSAVNGLGLGAVAVLFLSHIALEHRRLGVFFSLFLPAMIVICLAGAAFLSHLKTPDSAASPWLWDSAGPLLLFLGLLTLLNAPFDWASLGLTRALLRRGLELGGWWPYFLALVDACLAAVIIALLALTMVVGVQAFDELAVHGGGEKAAVLPLPALFDGIANDPAAPEYWWAYALLLSSMIPSLINLAIGGMALSRGVPGLGRLLLQWMPEAKAVPEYKRQPAAIGLTLQMFAGAGLSIAAQALLASGLIFHLMPALGLDLLDMARAVAAFDLPARIGKLFAGTL